MKPLTPYRLSWFLASLETLIQRLRTHIDAGEFVVCTCGHRRYEHLAAKRSRDGQEWCMVKGCDCSDFDLDHLRDHEEREAA